MPSTPSPPPLEREWLDDTERARLRELEDVVERGVRSFVETGEALTEIRDRRLYRESGATFEAYCKARFGLSRTRAYQLIDATAIVAAVHNVDTPAPASEAVARELVPFRDDLDAMRETWETAVDEHGPAPTASQVREVRLGPADDLRFMAFEDAVRRLKQLPALDEVVWPVEPGDVKAVGEALAWLASWVPKANAAFKQHRRDMHGLRAAR